MNKLSRPIGSQACGEDDPAMLSTSEGADVPNPPKSHEYWASRHQLQNEIILRNAVVAVMWLIVGALYAYAVWFL